MQSYGWCRSVLSLFFGVFPIISVAAETESSDASKWLERLAVASRTLNYEGTFVYAHGASVDAMHIIHKVDKNGEQEKLISLNGEPSEIIRNNDKVTCFLPGSRQLILEKAARGLASLPASNRIDFDRLQKFYQLKLESKERIAGHSAQAIFVKSLDPYRYDYRLWIDVDSGLLLKTAVFDQHSLVEQVLFTELQRKDSISDNDLKPSIKNTSVTSPSSNLIAAKNMEPINVDVGWVPDGFVAIDKSKRKLSATGHEVSHISLSDGLTTISVFVEPATTKTLDAQTLKRGAVNAFSVILDSNQITAVGEVPSVTVKRVAESVVKTDVAAVRK